MENAFINKNKKGHAKKYASNISAKYVSDRSVAEIAALQ